MRYASSGEDGRVGSRSLLGGRAHGEARRADRGMRVERLELLLLAQPSEHAVCLPERILDLGQSLDESGAALEELVELFGGQLPR